VVGQDSRISISVIHGRSVFGGPTMLTTMTEQDWKIVLQVFQASRSRRRDNDRRFLEALHYFVVGHTTNFAASVVAVSNDAPVRLRKLL
jgi:hypothetical protein